MELGERTQARSRSLSDPLLPPQTPILKQQWTAPPPSSAKHIGLSSMAFESLPAAVELPDTSPFFTRVDSVPLVPPPPAMVAITHLIDTTFHHPLSDEKDSSSSSSSRSEDYYALEVKQSDKPFPLLRLAVNEITCVFLFLDVPSLIKLGKVNTALRTISASEVVWRNALWMRYCKGRNNMDNSSVSAINNALLVAQPKLYTYAITNKKGWKAGYLQFRIPPLVPSTKLTWDDFQVIFFLALNTADIITDFMVLVGYAAAEQWAYFGISVSTVVVSSIVLCKMDDDHKTDIPKQWLWLLNFLQLRMFFEAFCYYRKRFKRMMATGTELRLYAEITTKEEQDAVQMVKLLEGICESAPQTLLQNYTLIGLGQFSALGIISIALSLFSVSLVFAFLKVQSHARKLVVFFFIFSSMCFRFVGLAIFAASFGVWVFLPMGVCLILLWINVFADEKKVFMSSLIAFMALFVPLFFDNKMRISCIIPYVMVVICSALSLALNYDQAYALPKLIFLVVVGLWHGTMFAVMNAKRFFIG